MCGTMSTASAVCWRHCHNSGHSNWFDWFNCMLGCIGNWWCVCALDRQGLLKVFIPFCSPSMISPSELDCACVCGAFVHLSRKTFLICFGFMFSNPIYVSSLSSYLYSCCLTFYISTYLHFLSLRPGGQWEVLAPLTETCLGVYPSLHPFICPSLLSFFLFSLPPVLPLSATSSSCYCDTLKSTNM